MKLFATCVFGAVLTVLALGPRPAAGEPWPVAQTPSAEILVNGVPVPMYVHNGRWYIEALQGREYAIRLHNPYSVRVAVALSVDGLNSIDARHTAAREARKWVINPFDSITIRGWQTSQVEARHFEFTTESASYGQALGRTANLGVISAAFFRERVPAPSLDTLDPAVPRPLAPTPGGSAPVPPAQESRDGASNRAEEKAFDGARRQRDDYAATGMGRSTDHVVRAIHLDLEDTPVRTVDIRYEFRPQLVRLGIVPRDRGADHLRRRERASGFEPAFSPIPHGH